MKLRDLLAVIEICANFDFEFFDDNYILIDFCSNPANTDELSDFCDNSHWFNLDSIVSSFEIERDVIYVYLEV